MKLIPLTKGKFAKVDDSDFHWLSQIKWQYQKRGYAVADLFGGRRSGVRILMHRLMLLAPDTSTVDHANHDTLDNRRANLRLATQSQQNANRVKTNGVSRYKGVYRRWDGLKWVAQIGKNYKKRSLACFDNEDDAARCYNAMARHLFKDRALLNDVTPRYPSEQDAERYLKRWRSKVGQWQAGCRISGAARTERSRRNRCEEHRR